MVIKETMLMVYCIHLFVVHCISLRPFLQCNAGVSNMTTFGLLARIDKTMEFVLVA